MAAAAEWNAWGANHPWLRNGSDFRDEYYSAFENYFRKDYPIISHIGSGSAVIRTAMQMLIQESFLLQEENNPSHTYPKSMGFILCLWRAVGGGHAKCLCQCSNNREENDKIIYLRSNKIKQNRLSNKYLALPCIKNQPVYQVEVKKILNILILDNTLFSMDLSLFLTNVLYFQWKYDNLLKMRLWSCTCSYFRGQFAY